MTLAQYWTIVVKRYKLIVICFLAVGLGALIGSKLMTPLYQATELVQIVVPSIDTQSDYSSLLASEQLIQTEAILATSDPILRTVASHYPGLRVDQLSKEVTATPKLNTQLFEIDVLDPSPTRAAALANDIAETLIQQQLRMAQQQQAQAYSFFLITQPAQPTFTPVRPNILLNTSAGLLTGLLLGILLAILFERLDTRARTPETLSQLLRWSILATIWKADPGEEVINPKRSNANVESYRILRTNIGLSAIDKPVHSLLVTSASPGDGKSTVAANLAIFMAKAGKKTLLIDANLRRPTLHEIFNLSANEMGLSTAILAFSTSITSDTPADQNSIFSDTPVPLSSVSKAVKTSLEPFIHAVDVPNLFVIPAGPLPPNPSELLDSEAMQHLFTALASCGAQIVIFDTAPLPGLSDASILASKVDGALVVVDITRANKGSLWHVQTLLAQAGARVLGCVVNKQHRSRRDTLYSPYYSIDEQNGINNHNKKNVDNSSFSSATLNALEDVENTIPLSLLEEEK